MNIEVEVVFPSITIIRLATSAEIISKTGKLHKLHAGDKLKIIMAHLPPDEIHPMTCYTHTLI